VLVRLVQRAPHRDRPGEAAARRVDLR
jgi:hypothetical protein